MTSELLSLQFWVQDWLAIISLYRPKSIYFFFSPKVRGLFWDNYTQTLNNSLRYPEEPSIVQKKNQGVVNDGWLGCNPRWKLQDWVLSCGCGIRTPVRAEPRERQPGSPTLTLTSLPCFWGLGSWVRAFSQCANRSQCIQLNTSVPPRRNLMSQKVLEQALLFQSMLLGGIFLHTSCVAR